MSKTKVNVRLESSTLGLLHLFLDQGETDNLYGIIDTLVSAYAENYAEVNEIELQTLMTEAERLFLKTRRPQTSRTKEEQEQSAKKSVAKIVRPRRVHSPTSNLTDEQKAKLMEDEF